jgi:hypothetical protein
MTVTITTNLPDFRRQLKELKAQMTPIASFANRAGANEFRKAVRKFSRLGGAHPDRRTGRLSAAVVVKRARRVPGGEVMHIVGIRQGKSQQRIKRRRKSGATEVNLDAYYWRFLEQGFYPRKPGTALRGGRRTKALQRDRAKARGEAKITRSFLLPAFHAASASVLRVHAAALEKAFADAAKKETK